MLLVAIRGAVAWASGRSSHNQPLYSVVLQYCQEELSRNVLCIIFFQETSPTTLVRTFIDLIAQEARTPNTTHQRSSPIRVQLIMFSNFSSIFSTLKGNTSSNESSSETEAVTSIFMADNTPIELSTLVANPASFSLIDDQYFDISNETTEFDKDTGCEYVMQSACVSAEIQSEMDEVLNEIMRAQCGAMNYAAKTKTMTDTISVQACHSSLARKHEDRSRDEVISNSIKFNSEYEGDEQSLSDDIFDYGDARAAANSFGSTKVSNYYRTKPLHDAARQQRMQAVAKRSSRHPNDRKVASQAHYSASGQKRSAVRGVRGGRFVNAGVFQ